MSNQVADFFDSMSDDYNEAIDRCFPWYRKMLWALMEYLPADHQPKTVLDLGCGTGNLSTILKITYPQAKIHFVDISGDSLAKCRSLLGEEERFTYTEADFRDLDYAPGSFDLIASSIAIHHLTSPEKQTLFQQIYGWLSNDGLFSFCDQMRGATDDLYACHIKNWKEISLAAGSTEEEFAVWMEHQNEHDYHDLLKDQLDWLIQAGFDVVDCTWRYLLWSVVQARKSATFHQ